MHLYIAEKPSLGRAIAAALPGPVQKGPGWLRCGQGENAVMVSWCIGHLLEPAEPARYDPRWKHWQLRDLPIFPEQWQLTPRPDVEQQLTVLTGLIHKALVIYHAGDPDREGQLLVDEVIRFAGARCPVQRVLINDLTPAAVARALTSSRDNREFRRLSHSALARQRADWLYGINLTRLYTLSYRQQGADGVWSVGRVQTPVLGLVVRRDDTIAAFEPKPWFRVIVTAHGTAGDEVTQSQHFEARWLPSERLRDHLDEEDRLLDRAVADQIADAVRQQPGKVLEARFRDRREPPPLPLSLSALQIEAGKVWRMGAKDVLDIAQSLYEKHQLITYPRSDCRYLPEEQFSQASQVTEALGRVDPGLASLLSALNLQQRSNAWNDSKVDAHHAIIPTARSRPRGQLSDGEARIYSLVARYYLMQFLPDAVHREGRLDLSIAGHRFRASETAVAEPGWKQAELRSGDTWTGENSRPARAPLPRLGKGDPVLCDDSQVRERMTQAPQPFTDATLLSAMTNIARFVSDPNLRKTLRETDGLGTEATRAAILETLFRRTYLKREGRFIRATDKGRTLIHGLPETISQPDMTAQWEASLEQIRQGEGDPRQFLEDLKDQIRRFIDAPTAPVIKRRRVSADAPVPGVPEQDVPGQGTPDQGAPGREAPGQGSGTSDAVQGIHCPLCRAPMTRREGKFGAFRACTRFPDCKGTRPLEDTAPTDGTGQKPHPCPACFAPLTRRNGKKGWFWGCSNFPSCRQTVNDVDGSPAATARPLRKST